jgi:hypothetical protein
VTIIEHPKNQQHEPKTEQAHGHHDHGAELERTLRHALALAVTERAARRAHGGPRLRAHRARQRARRKATGHLVGYGALLGYIAFLTHDAKQPDPVQTPSRETSAEPSTVSVPAPS